MSVTRIADNDELAWAACQMYLATGDASIHQLLLSWFDPCVDPQQNFIVNWWGTVKAGTAQGTVINNRADC